MGGRVAEELSEMTVFSDDYHFGSRRPVYGAQHVTSGASSDIQGASDLARSMVKVSILWSWDRRY